jgi:hypothetical protein
MAPTKQNFWDIKKYFIKQNDTTYYLWDPLDDKSEEDFQKVSEHFIFICECMKPVPLEKIFLRGVPSSNNHMECFHCNSHCKLDGAVRFTIT